MKKYLFILFAAAILTSCKDWIGEALDIDPSDRYSVTTVWSTTGNADMYLLGLYNFIKENNGTVGGDSNCASVWDAYSDILKSNSWNQYNHPYNSAFCQNSWNGDNAGAFECWSDCYNRIRRCNEFLRDAPVYGTKLGDDFVQTRCAEMRCIRAYIYLKLMKIYGKCIIRDAVDGPDQNDKALATPDEVWDFIESDLRYAGSNIRKNQPRGRITRAYAWGLLSKAALYAHRWDVVIDAADSCEAYGGTLDPSYDNIFESIDSPELLLTFEFVQNKLTHRADVFFRPLGDGAENGKHPGANVYAVFGPTSELVDSYEMADGTPFSWETNGADPYTGRDPRFYSSILYNGATWEGRKIETFVSADTTVFKDGIDKIVEFNTSGAAGSTVTGYYLKKFIYENQTGWEKYGSDHFAIVMRFAEVVLNKAEAYAQKGDFVNAYIQLNRIRDRVGMPAKTGSDLDTAMADIKHERMVELAGEGQRFWDLRRWEDAVAVIGGKNFHGCWITKKTDGTFDYKQVSCDGKGIVHTFLPSYYAFSLPKTEINNNNKIGPEDNNPGW
ncbi:MAG: RagB/SusD family nutrient uptake outer membrane protein [Bacteroidales bacterium]|nr:RagB/SusD family nutrient uptake outer membrane protein [Bacteroidales bacterium]